MCSGELLEWMRPTSPPRVVHGGVCHVHGSPWAFDVESSHETTDVPFCSTMLSHDYWKNRFGFLLLCVRENERDGGKDENKRKCYCNVWFQIVVLLTCWILCFVSKLRKSKDEKKKENKLKIKQFIFFIFVLSIFQIIF